MNEGHMLADYLDMYMSTNHVFILSPVVEDRYRTIGCKKAVLGIALP